MSKQKDIRQGVAKDIYTDWAIGSRRWEELLDAEKRPWLKTADAVLKTEDSQGVVIESRKEAIFHHGYFPTVEPLIEK